VEARLKTVLGQMEGNLQDVSTDGRSTIASAAELSDTVGVAKYQVGPMVVKTIHEIEAGDYSAALNTAVNLRAAARNTADPLATLLADRVMAQAAHFYGDHSKARELAEHVLSHRAGSLPLAYTPMAVDRRVSMRIVLSRVFWMQGLPEQAVQAYQEGLEFASSDSPFARCQALALAACPVAFWRGDYAEAQRLAQALVEEAARYRLGYWGAQGEFFELVSDRLVGKVEHAGEEASGPPGTASLTGLTRDTLLTIDPGAVDVEGSAGTVGEATGWCAPEILRVLGERKLTQGRSDCQLSAEALFLKSLKLANAQDALAWKLRTAISLASLWHGQHRGAEARDLLSSVYGRFSEGHNTRDLRDARTLSESLK
jgi:hypothetical protein